MKCTRAPFGENYQQTSPPASFPNKSEDAPPSLINSDDEGQAASTIQDSDFSAQEVPSDSPPVSPISGVDKDSRAAPMTHVEDAWGELRIQNFFDRTDLKPLLVRTWF